MAVDILKQWTFNKIKENPKLYGGDKGNPAIISAYFTELHGNTKARELTFGAISISVSISRMRNKILKKHKQYDHRTKHTAKEKYIDRTPSLFNHEVA